MENNKEKVNTVFSNLAWRFAERFGAKFITFIVNIVLARLLLPEEYGLVALIDVFIVILQVFVDSGLGNALIQKLNADDTDFSTVFYFNIAACSVLYCGLFFLAPFIARFYNNVDMIPLIRVVGLTLIISGVKNVQQAYVSRNMLFKKFFYATLGGTLFSAVLGISLAYAGAGAWALVAQNLSNLFIDTAILWITVKWRPKVVFSWKRFKGLFSFGWRLLLSSLLETVYSNLRNLVIGKKYTAHDLAYYQKGQQFPQLIVTNINASIGSVLFPALASEQEDLRAMRTHVRKAIQVSSYLMWPMMIGLGVCAKPLIILLLTEKWLPCVPYLQIACFTYGLMPIHTTNLQAITAMGRSDWYLKLEIIKKIIGLTVLIISMQYGVLAIALSSIFTGIASTVINTWPNRKLLKYTYVQQMKDIMPSFLLASFMGMIVYQWNRLDLHPTITLLLQIPTGAVIYVLGSWLFKLESFMYLLPYVSKIFNKLKLK